MGRPTTSFEFTVRYEPAENGWMTASIPSLPGTISMGRTRAEARANVLDALAQMLAVTPEERPTRGREERVHAQLGLVRVIEAGRGHGH
jgi:predicted RNase H-like HicB family nuclease